jgi:hypothetical protein
MISPDIFPYLSDELPVAKGEANVLNVAAVKRRGQVNIHAENFMLRFNDLNNGFPTSPRATMTTVWLTWASF